MAQDIICDMSVFTPAERTQHEQRSQTIFEAATAVQERGNGYMLTLPSNLWQDAATFVWMEHRCCPFFDFELSLTHDDTVTLWIGGTAEVKAYLDAEGVFN